MNSGQVGKENAKNSKRAVLALLRNFLEATIVVAIAKVSVAMRVTAVTAVTAAAVMVVVTIICCCNNNSCYRNRSDW
jgi:hypothetical protein